MSFIIAAYILLILLFPAIGAVILFILHLQYKDFKHKQKNLKSFLDDINNKPKE